MTLERWLVLMHAFGFVENRNTFCLLEAAYSERHRHYHTVEHITECLKHLDAAKNNAQHPYHIELALWFHDAVYKPRSTRNELNSGNWAKSFLVANGASNKVTSRIFNLILATLHSAPTQTADEALLVDIDLAILGASNDRYDEFEAAIRQEYKWVPYSVYREKRKKVLKGFVERPRIYSHALFFESLEAKARLNLQRAIHQL